MKHLSIRTRVAIWYSLGIILILGAAVFIFTSFISSTVISRAQDTLVDSVDQVVDHISLSGGKIHISTDINYHRRGSDVAIFNEKGVMISGLLSQDFPEGVPFVDAEIQEYEGEKDFYVYDRLLENPRTGDMWVRGIRSAEMQDMSPELMGVMQMSYVIFPLLLIISILGGLFITSRAFKPLKQITDTAKNIAEKGDLSHRIPLGDENSKDEIIRAAGVFNNMLDKVQYAFDNEKRFTNDASHELRTPTAVIMAQSEYALENIGDKEDVESSLETIHSESEKMNTLVSELLTLARADNGKLHLEKQRTDISLIAEESCERMRSFAAERGVQIVSDCDIGVYMDAEPIFFGRIYDNLITNAIKYSKENGHIYLSVKQDENKKITIIVRDDGIGIDEEALPHIFDRFYRENATYRQDSLGLGLSIVKLIVEEHNGTITCSSVKDIGTRFTISFQL